MSLSYLALGDSYTIGEGVRPAETWPAQLVAMLREERIDVADPRVVAGTGWTTQEMLAAITAAKIRGTFAMVSLLIGVNDHYRCDTVGSYRSKFRTAFRRAVKFAGGDARHVLVLSIPDWGVTPYAGRMNAARAVIAQGIDTFNAANCAEALAAGAPYVDVTRDSRTVPGSERILLAADGLHPSARMYWLWARRALPFARAVLGGA
jgi:lysophospholipase L1-like esterase